MKKLLTAAAVLPLLATGANAQTTDSLNVEGKIDYQCTLQLDSQTSGSVSIGQLASNAQIGAIDLGCNDADGFDFTITADFVMEDSTGTYAFPYQLGVQDNAVGTLTKGYNATDTVSVPGFVEEYAKGVSLPLFFRTNGTSTPLPGNVVLEDKITFAIQGKV